VNRAQFTTRYATALRDYLRDESERSLLNAYELGREVIQSDISLLDVAAAHHDVLAEILANRGSADRSTVIASGDFLVEALSSFEMVKRGFPEAERAARTERLHARMLRRLSQLLADQSLAAGDKTTLGELLQLVAEHALEITDCRRCAVFVDLPEFRKGIAVASKPEIDDGGQPNDLWDGSIWVPPGASRPFTCTRRIADWVASSRRRRRADVRRDRQGAPDTDSGNDFGGDRARSRVPLKPIRF
jgi:hypothetical protein